MPEPKNSPLSVTDNNSPSLSIVGDTYRVLIAGEQTGGAYASIDMLIPPQGGPGPHAHAGIQESFYVLEGEVEVKTPSETIIARKGDCVTIPRGGTVHCFKNKSDTTAHLICIVAPAGLDRFFDEIGVPIAGGTFLPPPVMSPEEQQRLKSIAERYGQELFPPDYLD